MSKAKAYKVLRKVRHNGVEYNPAPDVVHIRKKRLNDGTVLLTPAKVRGFETNPDAPHEIPASAFKGKDGEKQLRQLIQAGTVEDPDKPKDLRPEALTEEEIAKMESDKKTSSGEGEIIPPIGLKGGA